MNTDDLQSKRDNLIKDLNSVDKLLQEIGVEEAHLNDWFRNLDTDEKKELKKIYEVSTKINKALESSNFDEVRALFK